MWQKTAIFHLSFFGAWLASLGGAQVFAQEGKRVYADGTFHLPANSVPYSSLASEAARLKFMEYIRLNERMAKGECGSPDACVFKPGAEKLARRFPVKITEERIGGVLTDVVIPASGVSAKNARRVLINLHGGGFLLGARYGARMEAIPIASVAGIKVISVDYRQAPQYKFPAASEDVAAVYRELLKQYPAENIGIYGCSAGGILSAQAVAWFQTHDLPRPGAIGILGSGAVVPLQGDSNHALAALGEAPDSDRGASKLRVFPETDEGFKKFVPYFDDPKIDLKDPLISPVLYPSVIKTFPPSLLISGTRDAALSGTVFSHIQLVKAGVPAELYVWEGAQHCSYAEGMVDADVPETREAFDVIANFFDRHLGR